MCLILIFGRCLSGAGMLARRVSAELGYRLIDRDAIVERAAAWGVPHAKLQEALRPVPVLPTWFRQDRGAELAALRAALAEEAADAGGVYSGCEGFLLPRHASPALRIRLNVPREHRVAELGRRLKLTDAEAIRLIRRADRANRRWVRQFAGSDDDDPALYDLVVNVDDEDFDSACRSIATFATHQAPVKVGPEYRAAMTEFALASRIEAALRLAPKTARLKAVVKTDRGLVFLAAAGWNAKSRGAVCLVISQIPGVRRLVFVDWSPRTQNVIGSLQNRMMAGWRPWAAGATVCGLLTAGSVLLEYADSDPRRQVTSVTGVITDTRCGGEHRIHLESDRGRCVRNCVRTQAKYALFDGARLYPLSDQSLGDQLAARAVTIAGRLDQKDQLLEVHSVTPTPGY
jgi:hypothetical protein